MIPVRISLTLAAALAFHVSMSPPTGPTPSFTISDPDTPRDRRAVRAAARIITTMLTKGLYWASAFTDTLIFLAPHLRTPPSLRISLPATGTLLSRIRLSMLGPGRLSSVSLHLPPLPLVTIAGTTLAFTGALLRRAAYRALGQLYADPNPCPGVCKSHRGARHHLHSPGRAHDALITNGPYALVRHPGYAGLALCTTGLVVLHLDALRMYVGSNGMSSWGIGGKVSVGMRTVALACAILSTGGAVWRIRDEERALKARFKGEWEAWAGRVQYRLIPGVY